MCTRDDVDMVEVSLVLGVLGRKTFPFIHLFFKLLVHTEHRRNVLMDDHTWPLPSWNVQPSWGGCGGWEPVIYIKEEMAG